MRRIVLCLICAFVFGIGSNAKALDVTGCVKIVQKTCKDMFGPYYPVTTACSKIDCAPPYCGGGEPEPYFFPYQTEQNWNTGTSNQAISSTKSDGGRMRHNKNYTRDCVEIGTCDTQCIYDESEDKYHCVTSSYSITLRLYELTIDDGECDDL